MEERMYRGTFRRKLVQKKRVQKEGGGREGNKCGKGQYLQKKVSKLRMEASTETKENAERKEGERGKCL